MLFPLHSTLGKREDAMHSTEEIAPLQGKESALQRSSFLLLCRGKAEHRANIIYIFSSPLQSTGGRKSTLSSGGKKSASHSTERAHRTRRKECIAL